MSSRNFVSRAALFIPAAGFAAIFSPGGCFAQAAPLAAATPAASDAPADDIIVLGTRRTDRTLANSASPVDVISAAELQTQPTSNLIDSIKNIVPSFFVGQNTISDASSFVRAPSLRGLPSDEVLVQLDGKRYNRSALVQVYSGGDTGLSFGSQGSDISAIPSIAIGNLQVLRDGATAQYGSDAIAGVLNFGLKHNTSGFEADAKYGQYYDHGDGKSKQFSATLGLPLGDRGFVDLSGEYDDDGQTSRGVTRVTALDLAHPQPGNTLATADPGFTSTSQIPNYPRPAQIWGSSPDHGYKLLLNSGYDVTSQSKLYFFVNVAHVKTTESFNYRPPVGTSVTDPNNLTTVDAAGVTHSLGANGAFNNITCVANDPKCPVGTTYNFKSLYPGGFTPQFVGITDEAYGTLGYKGKTDSGFSYDLSGSYSRNALTLSMYNSLSPSYGPDTQTSFNFGKLIQKEADANLDLSYPIQLGLASPLTLSAGGEYRREMYTQTSGDPQSYSAGPYASQGFSPGASGYGGTSPAAAGSWSLTEVGAYVDAEADITKKLSVGLAGRYEHYNTFGSATVGKFNAIYHILEGLSIRGTVGTGFHAPSPGQSHDEILTTNFVNINGVSTQTQTGTYPVTSPISQFYGAQTLKPEKSVNAGVGFVATPVHNLTMTVDGYTIKVKNRIFISQNFIVSPAALIAQPALAAVGVGGSINFFTNAFSTVTRGVDVVGTYHINMEHSGLLDLTVAYNYNKSIVSGGLQSNAVKSGIISGYQVTDVVHLAPNNRVTASAAWTWGNWRLDARENYYGMWENAVDYPHDTGFAGQKFGAKATTDLDISYTVAKHYTLTLGATDIFNTKPDKIAQSHANAIFPITGGTSDGQVYPRNGGPFGFNGGFYYARLQVKL